MPSPQPPPFWHCSCRANDFFLSNNGQRQTQLRRQSATDTYTPENMQ